MDVEAKEANKVMMYTTTTRRGPSLGMLIGLLALVALTSACAGNAKNRKMSDLNTSVRGYHTALRLGRYYEASRYLAPAEQQEFIGGYEELGEDFEIVEIEPKVVSLGQDGATAWSETEIRWFRLPDMTVHKDEIRATWKFSEDSNSWYIEDRSIKPNKKRKKRSPLPGVYASRDKKEDEEKAAAEGLKPESVEADPENDEQPDE